MKISRQKDLLQRGYRYALVLCRDSVFAKDLVQESWTKVRIKRGKEFHEGTWFASIKNAWIDECRRRKRWGESEVEENMLLEFPERREELIDLERALFKLKEREREFLFLNCVEGYSAREIAEGKKLSRNTVLSILARAKSRIRDLLSGKDEGKEASSHG